MTARILELVEIFNDLDPQQLQKIYEICVEESYFKDQVIFEEQTLSGEIYIVLEGEVEILVNANPSQDQFENIPRRIATMQKGQSFGEIALVDRGLRSAAARCISDECRLLVIERDALMHLLQSNLEIGYKVMTNLATDLCLKIRTTNFLVREALLYRSTEGA